MNSLPRLLRQSVRPSFGFSVSQRSAPRPHEYVPQTRPSLDRTRHSALPTGQPGVCLRCQLRTHLRTQSAWFSSSSRYREEKWQAKNDKPLPTFRDTSKSNLEKSSTSELKKDSSDLNISHQDEERLPSEAEQQRSKLSKQFSQMMDNVQGNIFIAGQRLNDLTGYSAIEKLKKDIEFYESRLREARSLVRTTKETYSAAINRRSASQREVNELLQRKHAWSSADLERFTSLYRSDHANEVAEAESHEAITHAERELEEAASRLNRAMLSRYHEEQIWSDKIRRMSTWGTWGLMGVNVLLFLVFQIAVEPWRRQRLVRGFEDKVKQAIENTSQLSSTHVDMAVPRSTEIITGRPVEESVVPESGSEAGSVTTTNSPDMPTEPASSSHDSATLKPELRSMQHSFLTEDAMSFEYWTDYVLSFFSDRLVLLSQRDLTIVSLQSAAAGAAAMGLLIAIFRPH